jgi:hypothetical protein
LTASVKRFEIVLLALFLACWAVNLLIGLRLLPFAGNANLSLYALYSLAVALGSLAGNVYARRRRGLPPPARRRLFFIYFFGPPAIVILLRAMAPLDVQRAAPLVPLYALAVYSIFFAVPLSLKFPSR